MSEIKRYRADEISIALPRILPEERMVIAHDHDAAIADYDKILAELHQESIEKDKTIADLKQQLEDAEDMALEKGAQKADARMKLYDNCKASAELDEVYDMYAEKAAVAYVIASEIRALKSNQK